MHISRHSLIFGLSYALDIAGKNNLSHSKSTAYLSVMIGREMGLSDRAVSNLYNAALLHDIALSNTYEIKQHCLDGWRMLKTLPLPAEVPHLVHYHHEFCNGTGPFGLTEGEIPISAQIIGFSSAFDDLFGRLSGVEFNRSLFLGVKGWIDTNKMLYCESILETMERLIKRESFLLDYFNYETKYNLSSKIDVDVDVLYGYEDVVKFAHCFADIIDCKSPFTFNHSRGIAKLARKAAAHLNFSDDIQNKMYIAGLLHDIGKLHVSTDILHKNGKLTPEERFEINKHTYYTRKILEQIDGFGDITNYAANHHEKLDGTGYPYRKPGVTLSVLERVMAICDVYQALIEERPYREKLPPEKVWGIIGEMADKKHLDADLIQRVKPAFV